jgi:hypothetical protein
MGQLASGGAPLGWLTASAASSRPGAVPLRIERPSRVMTIGRGRAGWRRSGWRSGRGGPSRTCARCRPCCRTAPWPWRDRIFRPSTVRFTEAKPRRIAAGTVVGPRDSGQQRSITVPHGQPNLKFVSWIGRDGAAGPCMACKRSRWAPRGIRSWAARSPPPAP